MLDPWIIEEIRRREEERRREERAPAVVEMPMQAPRPGQDHEERGKEEETPRGVVIIQF